MLPLHCGHLKTFVIHLPSVPTSTPGCDNNVSMQDVVLQVAVCMWHNHLRVVSMKTFSYHPSFAVLQIPATTFISNLTNQFFWYNAHIWYEKASHVCACHYSSKADCPRSLLKDDECLYCAPMVDALPLFLSFMSAGQMQGMQYPHLHFWATSSVCHFLVFSGSFQSWYLSFCLRVFSYQVSICWSCIFRHI